MACVAHLCVVHTNAADVAKWSDQIKGCSQRRAQTDHLDSSICSTAVSDLLDPLDHTLLVLHEIERLGTQALGEFQAAFDTVNSEQVLGLALHGSDDGTQANRAAPDNHDRGLGGVLVLRLQALEGAARAKVARGENIRHQDQGVVADLSGSLHHGAVGQRYSRVLGLAAIQRDGSKQTALFTPSRGAASAEEALAAMLILSPFVSNANGSAAISRTRRW
jgi:hypothetical protein